MFNQLAENARVWIYQSQRELTDSEVLELSQAINQFVGNEWQSHQEKVNAQGTIAHKRFIILAADESLSHVGGCSIDSSVKFIKSIDEQLQLDLFNRFNVAYKLGDTIYSTDKAGFQQLINDGKVDENTLVFNNMITTKTQLQSKWEVPVKESWHANVFQVAQVGE